ncbi:AraC family transcriptional regulator [Vagococcus intermedius]|uniref:AraC family transcriptional regulator n=1 Tax=Vagococcus intermedius TaxID=2991418 RepID=A0AAF0I4B8_9ENTE|nr:AraC family transcriptional regulator [Vagococcus intermedius]WEG72418.1 AraC family transcriptional regulator [Vagococcus intermedius]WEG74506.1 AraC family transcriptional regulator [Vagococcus intermedius]
MKVCFADKKKDPIDGKPLLMSISKVESFEGVYKRSMHFHKDFLEVVLVTKGKGEYLIDGRSYLVKQGDLLIFNSLVAHDEYLRQDKLVETYCCSITNICKKGLRENTLIPDNICPVFDTGKHFNRIKVLMSLLFDLLQDNDPINNQTVQSLFEVYLKYIEDNLFNHFTYFNDNVSKDLMHQVKTYLETHYNEKIALDSLAQLVNVSPYYLAHQFKKHYNCSPVNYLIKMRIGEAQTLLQNTKYSVTDIAFRVGFNNLSHFQTTFKKHTGKTPKRYRQDYQKINKID